VSQTWAFGPRRRSHRKAIAIGLLIGLLVAASVAVAAWLTSGNGTGYSKAGSTQALIIVDQPFVDIPPTLFPGSNGDLSIKVTNPNSGPVTIKSVTANGGPGSSDESGCSNSNVTFTNQTGLSLGPIPASGTTVITVPGSVHLDAGAPTTCQGVTFSIPVTVTGSL
jgi:hypothetical protein